MENNALISVTVVPSDEATYKRIVIHDVNEMSGVKKYRAIFIPSDGMRKIHAHIKNKIKRCLQAGTVLLPSATGWVPKSSVKKHLLAHRTKGKFHRYWFVTDIHSAFPSVGFPDVVIALSQVYIMESLDEYTSFVKKYLWHEKDGLMQGLPASPILFNMIAEVNLDRYLRAFCRRYQITYTRYGDDMVFSSDTYISKAVRAELCGFVARAKFSIGQKKTKFLDLKQRGSIILHGVGIRNTLQPQMVAQMRKTETVIGTRMELKSELFIPKLFLKKIKGVLTCAVYKGSVLPSVVRGYMGILTSIGMPASSLTRKIERLYFDYKQMFPKPVRK